MNGKSQGEHLTPELFVDLLEGGPVEAAHREHAERCVECRRELEELRGTLEVVRGAEGPAEGIPDVRVGTRASLAAAAVLLVAVVSGYIFSAATPRGVTPETAASEELLPPVDEDGEFQVLLALSQGMEDELELESVAGTVLLPEEGLAPEELTAEEQQRLVEELAGEL